MNDPPFLPPSHKLTTLGGVCDGNGGVGAHSVRGSPRLVFAVFQSRWASYQISENAFSLSLATSLVKFGLEFVRLNIND